MEISSQLYVKMYAAGLCAFTNIFHPNLFVCVSSLSKVTSHLQHKAKQSHYQGKEQQRAPKYPQQLQSPRIKYDHPWQKE